MGRHNRASSLLASDQAALAVHSTESAQRARGRLLFVVTEDWYFVSHRLALAVAAQKAGYDVAVLTRVARHQDVIEQTGIRLIPFPFNRSGLNPIEDGLTLLRLAKIYRAESPDIVHHVAMKPVVYGSLAAKLAGVPAVVNALGGLGYVFSPSARARAIRLILRPLLKLALTGRTTRIIVQNRFDRDVLIRSGLVAEEKVDLIRGAGVDPDLYPQTDVRKQPPLVVLASRLLRDKGVYEFVEAARQVKARGIQARFALVGAPDQKNPNSVPQTQIDAWAAENVVEAWGWCDDMPAVLAQAQIMVLPTTYPEGLPKILLEGAAAGCAILASDAAGCRELVTNEETGLIVAPHDTTRFVEQLVRLITEPELRARLGQAARHSIAADFSLASVVSSTLMLYSRLAAQNGSTMSPRSPKAHRIAE